MSCPSGLKPAVQVDVDKPLGIKFKELGGENGGLIVTVTPLQVIINTSGSIMHGLRPLHHPPVTCRPLNIPFRQLPPDLASTAGGIGQCSQSWHPER